jgi:TM2 domain-containing membrane protein YozV
MPTSAVNVVNARYVGALELAAFVAIGGLLQLIGGQTTSAWVACAANLVLLLVLYVWIAYGVSSILRFTARRIGEQLAAAVDLRARDTPAPPVQRRAVRQPGDVAGVLEHERRDGHATGLLLVVVGSALLVVRLHGMSSDGHREPPRCRPLP